VGVHEVPEASPAARGKPIVNLVNLEAGETVARILSVRDFEAEEDLVFLSARGFVKRTPLRAYANIRAAGLTAVDVVDGDELLTVERAPRDADLLVSTRSGRAARFAGASVREMGRVSRGVRGIRLRNEQDGVVDLSVLTGENGTHLVTVTANGYGKRTALTEYPRKGRGSQGVFDIATDARNGAVVDTLVVAEGDQLLLVTDSGRVIRMRADDVRQVGRRTRGVRLMRLSDGERIVAVERILAATAEAMASELPDATEAPEPSDEPVEELAGVDDGDDGEGDAE
jgi:DNA gyrase subunit A